MKILVLTKRHHMGQDALAQLHGRYFAIPEKLACNGHQIMGLVLNYHATPDEKAAHQHKKNPLWVNIDLRRGILPRFDRVLTKLATIIQEFKPDIIWTGGDAVISIIGTRAAIKHNIPCILDLKDNYEAFGLSKIPGIKKLLHSSITNATAITCASEKLCSYAINLGAKKTLHLPNAADDNIFYPQSKDIARQKLHLPKDIFLIGTAGALTKNRGISNFTDALKILSNKRNDFGVLVSGPRDNFWSPPEEIPIFDLGIIPVNKVPLVFNALDLGIICNINNTFGNHCYPQKFHEMQACQLPVIASRIGPFESSNLPYAVVDTFLSADELAVAINNFLENYNFPKKIHQPDTWNNRATALESFFTKTLHL